ncbi:MAG: minor capsid protein [Victivallales bacterium]
MSSDADAEDKSASYQSRRPKMQAAVERAFARGLKTLKKRMNSLVSNMKYQGGFSSEADARVWLNHSAEHSQIEMLREDAGKLSDPERKKLLRKINRRAYAYRYSREKALSDMIKIHSTGITRDILNNTIPTMKAVTVESYGRANFDIQKSSGAGAPVTHIPVSMLDQVVNSKLPFTYVNGYTDSITVPMREALFEGILVGKSVREIEYDVQKISGKATSVSKAFARTALAEVSNEAEKKTLEEAGLKKYRFIATLDERTCPVCGAMDGKIFYLKDAKVGTNFPPMHRNCRCVHSAVLTKTARSNLKRRARDENGEDIVVPQSMTYTEWSSKYMP